MLFWEPRFFNSNSLVVLTSFNPTVYRYYGPYFFKYHVWPLFGITLWLIWFKRVKKVKPENDPIFKNLDRELQKAKDA